MLFKKFETTNGSTQAHNKDDGLLANYQTCRTLLFGRSSRALSRHLIAVVLISFGAVVGAVALLICFLPEASARPWWMVAHVLLTFHFTTLSRLFFRSEGLEKARSMAQRLLAFDGHGVRPGLFRMQDVSAWAAETTNPLGTLIGSIAEHGVLWVLVIGIAYHWFPRRLVDDNARGLLRVLPGAALGVFVAGVSWLGLALLSGPRANIYFSF